MALPSPPYTGPAATTPPARGVLPQYGQFILVGLTGVVVNLVVFALVLSAFTGRFDIDIVGNLLKASSEPEANVAATLVSSAIAFVVATLWNFTFNSLWTFKSARGHYHSGPRRLALYYGVSLASLGVNELVLFALSSVLAPLYGQAVGIVAGSVVGFAGNRRFTFLEGPTPS